MCLSHRGRMILKAAFGRIQELSVRLLATRENRNVNHRPPD